MKKLISFLLPFLYLSPVFAQSISDMTFPGATPPTTSSPMPSSVCLAEPEPVDQRIRFFLGMQPSDGVLDVWCRIQQLKGDFRVNIRFPDAKIDKTFIYKFTGTPIYSKDEFGKILQSMIFGPDAVQKKQEILGKTVEGSAPTGGDDTPIGFPIPYKGSKSISLWTPIDIRVRPIMIEGHEFTMIVRFQPSIARWIMGIEGQKEALILQAEKDDVLSGEKSSGCPTRLPSCSSYEPVVQVMTAWMFEGVRLESDSSGISRATKSLFNALATANKEYLTYNTMDRFDATVGGANVVAEINPREMKAEATPDPKGVSGTQSLFVLWRERRHHDESYFKRIDTWARNVRQQLIIKYGANTNSMKVQ